MAAITLSNIVGGGGSPIIQLAPNLTHQTDKLLTSGLHEEVAGIDATAGLTELLGLTGRWEIQMLRVQSMLANNLRELKMTIDGVDIWDETGITVNATALQLFGSSATNNYDSVLVESSFSFSLKMFSDTSITFHFSVRPIL